MIYNSFLNNYEYSSCAIYIVLFVIFFIISISISSVFIYFTCYLKRKYIECNFIEYNSIECSSIEHMNGKYWVN